MPDVDRGTADPVEVATADAIDEPVEPLDATTVATREVILAALAATS